MLNIVVYQRRPGEWIAYPNGDKGIWEAGKTEAEALGKLLVSLVEYPDYRITIQRDENRTTAT